MGNYACAHTGQTEEVNLTSKIKGIRTMLQSDDVDEDVDDDVDDDVDVDDDDDDDDL